MNFNLLISIFTLSCLIVCILTFLVRKKFILFGIFLSLVFYSSMYYTTSELVGIAKPIEYNIPLFNTKSWPTKGLRLLTYYYNTEKLYILVNNINGNPRLYSMPFNAVYVQKLQLAIKKGGNVSIMPLDLNQSTDYDNTDSAQHLPFIVNDSPLDRNSKIIETPQAGNERFYHPN
jgi:hypothetical protein